ncbi:MAG TPA: D-alanyl-D-alanine carboxypeptidase [Syntrophomonadaceae bacterium]|jgi:D-alanyl-D-alanine carboxypeptidase (penicillin-binding protein 5/6)|nr:D-alanyl-D-alanine carboxypeptidase [Syntrophomonadaceae bacterium]
MKKRVGWVWIILIAFICWGINPAVVRADIKDIKAESYVLMDADSGKVLAAKNEHKRLPPASMTKLMTMILAIEALEEGRVNLQDKVVSSENASKMGGSQIYLEPGEEMTYEDLLISIAVGSANDACVAIAEHLEGTHKNFVARMNSRAREIGLKNTHFINAYGLPASGQYTSAYDMAQIGRYALKYPRLLEYTSIKEYPLRQGAFKLYNTNKLLWWYQGTDGYKTGWTNEAKYCLVSTVKRDDLRLIAVVMASPEVRGHFRDSMQLYNYGFARYDFKTFYPAGSICGVVRVGKGIQEQVDAVCLENAGLLLKKGDKANIECRKKLLADIDAPVRKGQKIGEITILKDDKIYKKVDVVAAEDVEHSGFSGMVKKILVETFLL